MCLLARCACSDLGSSPLEVSWLIHSYFGWHEWLHFVLYALYCLDWTNAISLVLFSTSPSCWGLSSEKRSPFWGSSCLEISYPKSECFHSSHKHLLSAYYLPAVGLQRRIRYNLSVLCLVCAGRRRGWRMWLSTRCGRTSRWGYARCSFHPKL